MKKNKKTKNTKKPTKSFWSDKRRIADIIFGAIILIIIIVFISVTFSNNGNCKKSDGKSHSYSVPESNYISDVQHSSVNFND